MSYPWVPAPDNWSRGSAPVKAIVVHMAEGGGTVQWLLRDDGNSSHYVVEYTGRIVQMVKESRAAGSINPLRLRTTDDGWFTYLGESIRYGDTAAKRVLGPYWSNPNQAVIAIETEGFAKTGPNAAERGSLRKLIADIRSRHGSVPVLAHRDFQDWKACPGKLIPWADWGGHAAATVAVPEPEEAPMLGFKVVEAVTGVSTVKADAQHYLIRLRDGVRIKVPAGEQRDVVAKIALLEPLDGYPGDRTNGYLVGGLVGEPNIEAAFHLEVDVDFDPATPADTTHTVTLAVDGQEKAKVTV